ncbi:nucleoside-diphosphate sugar epimerase/dehydratase [Cognatishimia sp. D5M38]|uniref:Nucleoside-diphosphate sugar epimerase/dehydratase n=1 Tax=Cognatishimia coralii TaxID=3083254 RepID=A0ABU8QKY1_9RHOB
MFNDLLNFLFRLNRATKRVIQVLADALIIVLAFSFAMALRLDSFAFAANPEPWIVLVFVLPVTIGVFTKLGHYRAIVRYVSTKAVWIVVAGAGISAFTMAISALVLDLPIPRSVSLIYFLILALLSGGARMTMRILHASSRQDQRKKVAIYGAGEAGRQLLRALSSSLEYKPVLFIDDNERLQGFEVSGLPVMSFRMASQALEGLGVRAILLAMPSASRSIRKNIINQLERFPVEVKTLPGMADLIEGKASVNELRNVSIEELLGRDPVPPRPELMAKNIRNQIVLVSGAGGSIGGELCRQIIQQRPKKLVLLDVSEFALYKIHEELTEFCQREGCGDTIILPTICSVQNELRVSEILSTLNVDTIYHAAAYKHVPLIEQNIIEGIQNNVFGTRTLAKAAIRCGVKSFTLVSTDKAVRPTNFMGASKRLAELVCQSLATNQSSTVFSIVRFGNVLGSSGSVIPRFRKQIESGGPITVTHKEINRYFMTIPEAAQLVIQASSMAQGGDVFVLDMGDPVRIVDLADKMVRLHGLTPYFEVGGETGDICIQITGLRPGEKLFEELLIGDSPMATSHPRIMRAQELQLSLQDMTELLERIIDLIARSDLEQLRTLFLETSLGFSPTSDFVDVVFSEQDQIGEMVHSKPDLRLAN